MYYFLLIFGLTITAIKMSKADNSTSCVTPNCQPGLCIELNRCTDLYNSEKPQLSSQKSSFLHFSTCGYSNGNVMYCCALRSIIPKPIIPKTRSGQITDGDTRPWVCGGGVIEPSYGVNKTKLGEFPWMALLNFNNGEWDEERCEGSLIHNRYVISSAYCIKSMLVDWSLTKVRLGAWNISTYMCIGNEKCVNYQSNVPVERVIFHENFNYTFDEIFPYNDLALIRLASQVQFTEWISPICLPTTNSLRTATFDRVAFYIAGWGYVESVRYSETKSKAMVIVHSVSTCNSIYTKLKLRLRDDQMCAGGVEGIDLCFGAAGTALIGLDTKNKLRHNYFLAGIYSFIPKSCNLGTIPSVYTRVGPHVDWILENIQP